MKVLGTIALLPLALGACINATTIGYSPPDATVMGRIDAPNDIAAADVPASPADAFQGMMDGGHEPMTDVPAASDVWRALDGAAGDGGVDVPIPPPGAVVCHGAICAPGHVCCLTTGSCYDPTVATDCPLPPRARDPQACASNAHCASTEFCDLSVTAATGPTCEGVGTCQPQRGPELCGGFGAGVCGCDGRTYADPCEASRAGVRAIQNVPCGTQAYPNPRSSYPCSADAQCNAGYHCAGRCLPDRPLIACGLDSQCPIGLVCCAVLGLCLDPARPSLCTPPRSGTRVTCDSDLACAPLNSPNGFLGEGPFYCDGVGCTGTGSCTMEANSCTGVLTPVCGCDGHSYTNACSASAVRVRVAHDGGCS